MMKDRPLANKTFVITGKLSALRDEVIMNLERMGASVGKTITYGTDYLVAGEKTGAVKTRKAQEYGVPVISEDDLLRMIDRGY